MTGGAYDFENLDMEKITSECNQILEDQQSLKKKVNMKVEAMSDKVEKEYKSLIDKRIILEKDKGTIMSNIVSLDKKKKTTLRKCFAQVNENFGKIFGSLLHGCQAKLCQIPEKDLSAGLEMHVAFDEVWKNSLSELSGG